MCDTFALHEEAARIRKDIHDGVSRTEKAKEALKNLVLGKTSQSFGRPQPKTPEGAPNCLYYFEEGNKEYVDQEYDLKNRIELREITTFKMMSIMGETGGVDDGEKPIWTEDYLHIFTDGKVGTVLPVYNYFEALEVITQGQKKRLGEDSGLFKVLTASYTNTNNAYMPVEHPNHFFLRSMVDGGNMLTGSGFALIGKDSLHVTCIQNGMQENEAKQLIAQEMGYPVEKVFFVEQPGTYHLDLNMMLLGKGNSSRERIWVARNFKGVSLDSIHEELRGYGFDVIVDECCIAGKAESSDLISDAKIREDWHTEWKYNFFNGEFVRGKDGKKLYYVTNGTEDEVVKRNFENRLKEYIPSLEKVIYCNVLTTRLLNETHGGVGCRFKGGPAGMSEGLFCAPAAEH